MKLSIYLVLVTSALASVVLTVSAGCDDLGDCWGRGGSTLVERAENDVAFSFVEPDLAATRVGDWNLGSCVLLETHFGLFYMQRATGNLYHAPLDQPGSLSLMLAQNEWIGSPLVSAADGGVRDFKRIPSNLSTPDQALAVVALQNPFRQMVVRIDLFAPFRTQIILDDLPAALTHNGGGLEVFEDGTFAVAIGDLGDPAQAAQDGELSGRVLRFTLDGQVPADNPNPGSPEFARGLANPCAIERFHYRRDPSTTPAGVEFELLEWVIYDQAGPATTKLLVLEESADYAIATTPANSELFIAELAGHVRGSAYKLAMTFQNLIYDESFERALFFADSQGGTIHRAQLSRGYLFEIGESTLSAELAQLPSGAGLFMLAESDRGVLLYTSAGLFELTREWREDRVVSTASGGCY